MEVDVILFVFVDVVSAGDDDFVGELSLQVDHFFENFDAFEAHGGIFGAVPVPFVDACAAVDEFAYFSGFARFAVFIDDKEFDIGDRFADGSGADFDLSGVEVGGAEGFGESVHGEKVCIGEISFDIFQHFGGNFSSR